MQIQLIENGGCFSVEFKAETMQDAALLVRLAKNGTREVRCLDTYAHADGAFTGHIVIGKDRRESSSVRRGR